MQTASGSRETIAEIAEQFAVLHRNARELVAGLPLESPSPVAVTFRENILRGAAVVEQTFGGLTASLWDDPFEWTLPETLNTHELLLEYLDEVEATRRRAFGGLRDDDELFREIVVPSGERQSLLSLFRETIARARTFQDQAFAMRDHLTATDSEA
ncbi:MAG: hypothetical protein QOE77_3553 [Blastocatellia bacterium]|nr:hypothetical protein [Blastocatellia bacterium]